MRAYLKNNKRKMGEEVGGMAQVVEHLPSKCKTINSNPST
jgi:hypothetical protein